MSKKTNQRKKVGIKLNNNQSFFVEDLDTFIHMQKTYSGLTNSQTTSQEKNLIAKALAAIKFAIDNVYIANESGYEDEW
jgi:hypothetical protein